MGIGENVNLVQLELNETGFLINHDIERKQAQHYIQNLHIPAPYPQFKVRYLSSGNQQKVIVSRWMAASPRILLCDEPTHGVDIAGKAQIYELMNALSERNVAMVMVSSDLSEILHVCDRVLALRDGRLVCNLPCRESNRESILAYMIGMVHDD
jgi:ribose transport system ATP-binding protein